MVQRSAPSLHDRDDQPDRLRTFTLRGSYSRIIPCPPFGVNLKLTESDSLGLIFMDGDGSDSSYRTTHRGLALGNRRVIEDAIHIDSSSSQLVQMADHVAWSASATLDQHKKNEFAAQWYNDYLAERDPQREPQEL